jgi:hypothetical protein
MGRGEGGFSIAWLASFRNLQRGKSHRALLCPRRAGAKHAEQLATQAVLVGAQIDCFWLTRGG